MPNDVRRERGCMYERRASTPGMRVAAALSARRLTEMLSGSTASQPLLAAFFTRSSIISFTDCNTREHASHARKNHRTVGGRAGGRVNGESRLQHSRGRRVERDTLRLGFRFALLLSPFIENPAGSSEVVLGIPCPARRPPVHYAPGTNRTDITSLAVLTDQRTRLSVPPW